MPPRSLLRLCVERCAQFGRIDEIHRELLFRLPVDLKELILAHILIQGNLRREHLLPLLDSKLHSFILSRMSWPLLAN